MNVSRYGIPPLACPKALAYSHVFVMLLYHYLRSYVIETLLKGFFFATFLCIEIHGQSHYLRQSLP